MSSLGLLDGGLMVLGSSLLTDSSGIDCCCVVPPEGCPAIIAGECPTCVDTFFVTVPPFAFPPAGCFFPGQTFTLPRVDQPNFRCNWSCGGLFGPPNCLELGGNCNFANVRLQCGLTAPGPVESWRIVIDFPGVNGLAYIGDLPLTACPRVGTYQLHQNVGVADPPASVEVFS